MSTDDLLLVSALIFGGIALLAACVRLTVVWMTNRFVFGVGHDLGVGVYHRTLHQPYDWHARRNSSESLAAIKKVQMATSAGLMPLLRSMVAVLIAACIVATLITIDATIAILCAGGFVASYLVISVAVRNRIRRNGQIISRTQGSRIQTVQEGVGGIRDILIDSTQNVFVQRFRNEDSQLRRAQATNNVLGESPRYALEGIALVLISLLAWRLSAAGGIQGALPVLGAVALGGQKLVPLVQQIYSGWTKIVGLQAVIRDVLDLLSLPVPDETPNHLPVEFNREIRLVDVTFRYVIGAPPALQGVNLTINRGQRVGFVGKTGSGKSTLVDLIMGLLSPSSGRIEIDGVALSPSLRRRWQSRIAHVPQAIYLTDDTVRNNIAFGVDDTQIDDERVRVAARGANISEYIESLDQQYDTPVGENGIRLSGGQRQRIGIARALYKNADVLVLDEATSALDDATEHAVIECVEGLSVGLTVIMIAHRMSTLRGCDTVISLDAGAVSIIGSFDDVIAARNGAQATESSTVVLSEPSNDDA